jgi:RNA polymerase-binding transcription factor DksA
MHALPFSPDELVEFKELILRKMERAREEIALARAALMLENGTTDTDPAGRSMEDGRQSLEIEEQAMLIARQEKHLGELERALDRIRVGTYGICRITGQRIPRERLLLVPHSTLSMAAKSAAA